MQKRTRNNLIAVLILPLIWALMILAALATAGCAGQGLRMEVETTATPCGNKTVRIETDYQLTDFAMIREIGGGDEADPCGGGYAIKAGQATTKDADAGVIVELLRMIQALMAGQVGAPPPDPGDG